jgi:acetyltransferase
MGPSERDQLIGAYGVTVPPAAVVGTADEAAEAARVVGGEVVLKIEAPGIVHKSEVGGVLLGLSSAKEIRAAFAQLVRVASRAATATVHVQAMAAPGQDVIVGGIRDAQFGPLIMFGSGGIEAEAMGDVEFALAPLTRNDLTHLLANTRAGRRLAGHRSIPAGDVLAVEDALLRVGWLISDQPRIAEIEINPLRVFAPGSGTTALDVRVRLT